MKNTREVLIKKCSGSGHKKKLEGMGRKGRETSKLLTELALFKSSSGEGGGKGDIGQRDINPSKNRKEGLTRREEREQANLNSPKGSHC